jgi:putative ABC transport system permease protein
LLGLAGGVGALELVGSMENEYIHNPGVKLAHGIGATIFRIAAGALAGYFPARSAAKVNPIHALRDQ